MTQPLVSILIPAYNADPWIAQALESALAQTWANKEIIVVNDGSTDDTLAIAQQFATRGVTVLSQENQGAATARNEAFNTSKGDYIQWLDADDILAPDKIERQLKALRRCPGTRTLLSSAWGTFYYRVEKARFVRNSLWEDLSPQECLLRKLERGDFMQTAAWLVSRELSTAAGPWDTRLLGDDDGEYFGRVVLGCERILFVPEAKIYWRESGWRSLRNILLSDRKIEAHFLAMELQINYARSFGDTPRIRAACLACVQASLHYFYPEWHELLKRIEKLCADLGGRPGIPSLPWKYVWIQKFFGWSIAKRTRIVTSQLKRTAKIKGDKALFALARKRRLGGVAVAARGHPETEPPKVSVEGNGETRCGRIRGTRDSNHESATNDGRVASTWEGKNLEGSNEVQVGDSHAQEANNSHFSTDHLRKNLKGRAISSGFVTAVAQGAQFALTLVSTVILARLLTPREFGLLAMSWTIIGFSQVFREAGLSTATVQREGITHAQVSNLFWINVVVSGLVTLLVAAAAPAVAWFYREPLLVEVTLALSITILLAGLAVQHMALLNRQMRFKAIALIQVGSVLAGVLVGVGMAWLNYGYWSLVGMNLTTSMVALLMTWSASRWRPQSFTRRSGTRSLLHFGANLTVGTFLYSLARGLDRLLIGRFYGAFSVGLYSRASSLLARPLEQFMNPIEAVVVTTFSKLQMKPDGYRSSFLELYETIALVGFLFTGMCFALAHSLTLVVLGPKWEQAAIIFASLTFGALQYPLNTSASWLFTSQGRGRDSLLANSISAVVVAASFIAGLPFGPTGVAISYSASCLLIQLPIVYYLAGHSGPVSTADLWIGFLRQLPVWGIVTLVAWLVRLPIPDDQPFKELFIAAPAGFLAGAAFIFVYPPARRVAVNLFSTLRGLRNPA
jgi:O-antigen/teichoic acid export membrane protein/glycosyltransferase involved in cell wall biosynthesis